MRRLQQAVIAVQVLALLALVFCAGWRYGLMQWRECLVQWRSDLVARSGAR